MPLIAAALITKNSADTITKAVQSIRKHVDAIYVYDTGSTDDTVRVLRDMNVTHAAFVPHEGPPLAPVIVEEGEWRDDFSWAREQSFAMIPPEYDWVVWLDDDDIVENPEVLRPLAHTAPAEIDGYLFLYDYARDEHGTCVCQLWRERLIRRDRGFTWRNPVHEVLAPPDGHPAAFASIDPAMCRWVHHRPADRHTPDRNLQILHRVAAEAEAAGQEPDPRTLAYLGTELMSQAAWTEAAGWLERYLRHPDAKWSDERCQVHHKLAGCLRALGLVDQAIDIELGATRERDDWTENKVGLAQGFLMKHDWARAAYWARLAVSGFGGMPQSALILNPLEHQLVPLLILCDALTNMGDLAGAKDAAARAYQVSPQDWITERISALDHEAGLADVENAVLKLREVLVRHDENLKAHQLMDAVPYIVAERPAITAARARQREMVAHYLRPQEYERWYRDDPKESTVTDDVAMRIPEWCERATALRDGLLDQQRLLAVDADDGDDSVTPLTVDLGCNDYWMGAWLWREHGLRVDGVELNRRSYELALERRDRFDAPGVIVHGNLHDAHRLLPAAGRYDAVSLFEVLEHVPDIDETLDACERLLRPGGRVYISTPNGAYERGQITGWDRVERKGHLRAIPGIDLAAIAQSRGRVDQFEFQQDGRLSFVAYTPQRRAGRVVFYAGQQWEPWSPASLNTTGIGGSETALVCLATRLADQGHDVTVYSSSEPGLYAGVLYRPHTAWDPTDDPDLLVVSRIASAFDFPIGAKQSVLWCHDHTYPDLTPERAGRISRVAVLSDWQRKRFERLYPHTADKLVVLRNGITVDERWQPQPGFHDRKPRCVYSSSADRGLDVLLEMWPRIRERVPDAELHVFYGWDTFDRVAMLQPHLADYKRRVFELADAAGGEDGGVFMRGRLGQRDLAAEMLQARVWAYPTAFLETSCIGAMEARAAGLAVVTSALGALNETVGKHGVRVPWDKDETSPANTKPGYQRRFVDFAVELLTNEDAWAAESARSRDGVEAMDWADRAADWARAARGMAGKTKRRGRVAA